MATNEQETVLIQLGLTTIEAKAYVSLTKLNHVSIKTIARTAKVDRANLYRTISALQGKGLIQITLGEPNTYEAVPFNEGIERLLVKKTREFNELKLKSLEALEKLKYSQRNENFSVDDEGFFQIVPDAYNEFDKITAFSKAVTKSTQSIDTLVKGSDYIKVNSYHESQKTESPFEVQSKKGCHIRVMLFSDKNNELLKFIRTKNFSKYKGGIEIKIVTKPLDAAFAIIDRKDLFIHTKPLLSDWIGSPCLRSNNDCLVGTIQTFFDMLWSSAETNYIHEKQR